MQIICQGGQSVPAWRSLVSISSEQLAQLLEDVEPTDGIACVSVQESVETILTILSAIKGEDEILEEVSIIAAHNLGIVLDLKNSELNLSDSKESGEIDGDDISEHQVDIYENPGVKVLNNTIEIFDSGDQHTTTIDKPIVMHEEGLKSENDIEADILCIVCKSGRSFQTKKAHQRHMLKFHVESIVCDKCDEKFTKYDSYQEHQQIHFVECHKCNKTFNTSKKLQNHINFVHETERFPCPQCGTLVKNIQMHIKFQHSETDIKTCPVCDYRNTDMKQIDRHYRRIHTEIDITNCGFCGVVTKNLKRHLKIKQCDKNSDEKVKYQCDDCGKQFSIQGSLDKHKKGIHEQIKDKQCPHCTYCTYSGYNLKLHINKMHLGKKLVKDSCIYCGKKSYDVAYHVKLYHAEKF
jgi:hypothetical protein